MRILLQDQDTGLFLTKTNEWTGNKEMAKDFHSVSEIEKYCQQHGIQAAAIAVRGSHTYTLHLNCRPQKVGKQQ